MRVTFSFGLALGLALLTSCGGDRGRDAAGIEPERAEAHAGEAASSAPTRWVAPRSPGDASLLEAPAVARAVEASGDVSAGARVRVVRIHVRPGSHVAAGDPIVDVAAPELLEAAASYLGAGRGARAHGARAGELEALRAEGLASNGQIFEQRAREVELSTERDRAAALLRAVGVDPRSAPSIVRRGYLTLEAPIAGVVAALHAHVGEIHEPGIEPLARVFGEAAPRIEVRTSAPWPEASALRFVASDGRAVELGPAPIAAVVDPEDGSTLRWYAPLEPCALPDGLRGTARLSGVRGAWEVPATAIAQRTGASELLRRRGEAEARIPVEVLESSGASALVRGDLAVTDAVAADIAQVEVEPIEEGTP